MYLKIKQQLGRDEGFRWYTFGPFQTFETGTRPHSENQKRGVDGPLIIDDADFVNAGAPPVYQLRMKGPKTTRVIGVNVEDAYLLNEEGKTMEHLCFSAGRVGAA